MASRFFEKLKKKSSKSKGKDKDKSNDLSPPPSPPSLSSLSLKSCSSQSKGLGDDGGPQAGPSSSTATKQYLRQQSTGSEKEAACGSNQTAESQVGSNDVTGGQQSPGEGSNTGSDAEERKQSSESGAGAPLDEESRQNTDQHQPEIDRNQEDEQRVPVDIRPLENAQNVQAQIDGVIPEGEVVVELHQQQAALAGQQGNHEEREEEREERPPIQEEATQESKELTVSSNLLENASCLTRLSRKLDRQHMLLENWEHFACAINAPPELKAKCRMNTEKSPTESLFQTIETSSKTENLKVNELCTILGKLRRNDVKNLIEKDIPVSDRGCFVCDKICKNYELLEKIALKLDHASPAVKNWHHVGMKLDFERKELEKMKEVCNPAKALLEYAYSTIKDLDLQLFKDTAESIKRADLVKLMDTYTGLTRNMKDVIPLESDQMDEICAKLNMQGAMKGWRHMAYKLKIKRDIYDGFDPKKLQSPMRLLLEWKCAEDEKFTVASLCAIFRDMKRLDAIEICKEELKQEF